jgi:hypothetical protein
MPKLSLLHADMHKQLIRPEHCLLDRFLIFADCPAEREGNGSGAGSLSKEAICHLPRARLVQPGKKNHELITAHAKHRILSPHFLLEIAAHLDKDPVSVTVPVPVVVFLEMIQVRDDYAPNLASFLMLGGDFREIMAVVAASQGIPYRLFPQLPLQALAVGDIDQYSVVENLPCRRIVDPVSSIENDPFLAVRPADR